MKPRLRFLDPWPGFRTFLTGFALVVFWIGLVVGFVARGML